MSEPFRVLVVDDDPRFLKITEKRLQAAGYEVLVASEWPEVAPQMRKEPRLALLDVHMVALEGDELCRILKRGHEELRVLLVSSADPDELGRRARDAGADGWLSKSADGQAVVSAVQQQLALAAEA